MEKTWKPTTAGILNIISGASNLIAGITVAALGTAMNEFLVDYVAESLDLALTLTQSVVTLIIILVAILIVIHGIVSVLGGIYALKRRVWWLALLGSINTLLSIPLIGIPAIIFIVLSKKEFA